MHERQRTKAAHKNNGQPAPAPKAVHVGACIACTNLAVFRCLERQRGENIQNSRDGPQDECQQAGLPLAVLDRADPYHGSDVHQRDVDGHRPVDRLVLPVVHHGLHRVLDQRDRVQRQGAPLQDRVRCIRRHGNSRPDLRLGNDAQFPEFLPVQRKRQPRALRPPCSARSRVCPARPLCRASCALQVLQMLRVYVKGPCVLARERVSRG